MGLTPRQGRRVLAGAVLALAAYYAVWGGEYTLFDLLRLGRDRREAESRLARARQDVDSLRAQAKRLEDDPATIERVARERFGMIRDGETLYRFVPVDSAGAAGESRPAAP
ncbi:MAG TPA: septum formation initiator family protein [Longimicrobium sp.]|nr:septum formation initiator family protein [Longimicrobium sp.]